MKHFSFYEKKSEAKKNMTSIKSPNVESAKSSANVSPRISDKKLWKSMKTCPSLDAKKFRSEKQSFKKAVSSTKLPMIIPLKMLKITLKKGQAKGRFNQFIESKCKENKEGAEKTLRRENLFRINQM
jgi:hypothetical protein